MLSCIDVIENLFVQFWSGEALKKSAGGYNVGMFMLVTGKPMQNACLTT